MYVTTALLRRTASNSSNTSTTGKRLLSSLSKKPVSNSASSSISGNFNQTPQRSLSFYSALRSAQRWSHGVDWKSPASLGAQIRIASSTASLFQRNIATMASENAFNRILTSLPKPSGGEFGKFYCLPALNDPRIDKLPYSIRILLESAIRNCDGFQVKKEDVEKIIDWENSSPKQVEIPFKPARVLLQDFTGVPAVVDLACMRDAMNKLGSDSNKINPLVPVDLVIDHSVQVDVAGSENAVKANMELEFQRNKERFAFLKWGSNAFHNMLVVPPGSGIVHQVNLEYLGRVVFNTGGMLYPDSVVGTDSHTTMIDGLGVAGWGVGGIEAEAAMLGQVFILCRTGFSPICNYQRYKSAGVDTIVLAGAEYGSGSSRDWAAKGPMLLGVKAVIAKSFERIHRSNLVGMGIVPLCFKSGEDADTIGLTGHERFTIDLPSNINEIRPGQDVTVQTDTGKSFTCTVRFDTEVELAYFNHGGILPYVIRQLTNQ
ncbi:aconitate hydratase 3, mitochondrial-like [Olea europaea var. sylvestris]|nr:aconitate hydratase 3, mitochondrial-like [Olea europaea var. sylvestris]